jgi:hypothetical protein
VNHGIIIINQGQYDTDNSWHFSFLQKNYIIIILYILERSSSWSTSRIHPSWPQSRVELRLLLSYLVSILLVCLAHQVSCCLSQQLKFHAHPSLLAGQLSTDVQVNNTAAPHLMYIDTPIYITFILLFILFFTLLLLSLAGRLAQTLPVWHNINGRIMIGKSLYWNFTYHKENIIPLFPELRFLQNRIYWHHYKAKYLWYFEKCLFHLWQIDFQSLAILYLFMTMPASRINARTVAPWSALFCLKKTLINKSL